MMNNIFHISLLLIGTLCILTIVFKDFKETLDLINKIKTQKKNFEKKHEDLLAEITDSKQIFNYFLEKKEKLNDNLHNIMLGLALGDDFYAKLYLSELKVDYSKIEKRTGCRCLGRKKMLK